MAGVVLSAWAMLMLTPAAVGAAVSAPSLAMELLIVAPGHRVLHVFQEMVVKDPGHDDLVAVLSRATHVRGVGVRSMLVAPGLAKVESARHRVAMQYEIPWNGHSASLVLTPPAPIGELAVLVPPRLELPPVLNPWLVRVGQGPIPGMADSPRFVDYATGPLHAEEPVTIVFEMNGYARAAEPALGLVELLASTVLWLLGLMCIVAIGVAIAWRPTGKAWLSQDLKGLLGDDRGEWRDRRFLALVIPMEKSGRGR